MSIQLFLTFKIHYWHSLTNTVSNRQLKQFSKPWITSGLRKSIKVKNSLLQSGDLVNYKIYRNKICSLRACLHGGGGPQIGEVTCGGLPHLSCKLDQIKMRDYVDRRVTSPKRVTSPSWGPPPPCKQDLTLLSKTNYYHAFFAENLNNMKNTWNWINS